VSTITWRQVASTEIEVRYENGDVETVEGTHADAARMAQTAGLSPAASPLGTVQWVPGAAAPSRRGRATASRAAGAGATAPDEAADLDEDTGAGVPQGRPDRVADDAPRPKRIGPWLSQ
jgi:hypothetical protein